MGCSLADSSAPADPQQFVWVDPGSGVNGVQCHPPGGDGAGLVQHDRVDAAGAREHLGTFDQSYDATMTTVGRGAQLGLTSCVPRRQPARRQPESDRTDLIIER
jgi:hypothetical protein